MKKFISLLFLAVLLFVACDDDDNPSPVCDPPLACNLTPEIGPCLALITKYFYNQQTGECEQFDWGGCEGVVPFNTLEECQVCLCND